ncbi:MAG: hypothetical protein Q8O41_04625, partial [Candidatus Methanoperedens sp.]|nr:hypothetical protein [Candidatus Methanoperedens sp.]
DAVINKSFLYDVDHDDQFLLHSNSGFVAKTATKSEREELKGLIQAAMDADETIKLVKKVNDARKSQEEADVKFKKELAKIVRHVRFCLHTLTLHRIKEQGV